MCVVGIFNNISLFLFCLDLPDTAGCQLNDVPVVENLSEEDVSTWARFPPPTQFGQ